jgi:hypothetical protein
VREGRTGFPEPASWAREKNKGNLWVMKKSYIVITVVAAQLFIVLFLKT